ncbi:MAG TPA: Dickkopf N-terminal cysteine-rich domain-containing protein [Kofleriaceae bacterium]|nr:Dickkopf N-terminal cysteine-rich domain-containing protein [Kofleriaceae bacterium]
MSHSKRIGVFLVGALALAACGGDSISIGDLGEKLVNAECARYARCGVYTSKDACVADARANFSTIEASVAAGRIKYDGGAAADCLDAFESESCDSTTESARVTPPACDDAIKGAVADGGACFISTECVSRSCSVPDCGMACCQGTCDATVAKAAIGASCANADCVDGAFCNDSDVCAALLAAGQTCQNDDQCGYGLACGNNVCAPAANRGDACLDGRCSDIGDRCDGNMTCVALSGAGGACTTDFGGVFDCQLPLVCNQTTLQCENPPTAGQACTTFCANGLFCNDDTHQCEARRANGMACAGDGDCQSDFCDQSGANPVCAVTPTCS